MLPPEEDRWNYADDDNPCSDVFLAVLDRWLHTSDTFDQELN